IQSRLDRYAEERNDPVRDFQSHLSPWFHFGQIAPQRAALAIQASGSPGTGDALEQLIVRRELSDNFCFYVETYDQFEGFPEWARTTLETHMPDPRDAVYRIDQFESAATHDPLWNAAQKEMVIRGKMHGYLRMYWAKKILEWSPEPRMALRTAIDLNDRYSLDGRDPNGYTGIAWSIGGRHDRPWFERPVFGKIRYMSFNGAARKFDVNAYIRRVDALAASTGEITKETGDAGNKN
ncbi:MAG TPA: deoxyribodipyrimidine photolyase, partial [bacterium]|nr:deoxyribodipyrimidine photolyase [bacterium]